MKQIRQNQDHWNSEEERILSLERMFDENDLTDSIAGLQRWIFGEFTTLHQKLDGIKGLMAVRPAEIVSQGVGDISIVPETDLLNDAAVAATLYQFLEGTKKEEWRDLIGIGFADKVINFFYQIGRNDALSKPVEERTVYDWILIHNPGYKTAMLDSWMKGLAKPKSYSDSSGISGFDQEAEELMQWGAEVTRRYAGGPDHSDSSGNPVTVGNSGGSVTVGSSGNSGRSDGPATVGSSGASGGYGGSGGRMGDMVQPAQPKLSLLDLGMLNLDALAEDPRYRVGEAEDEDDSASPSSESEPDAAPPQRAPQYAAAPFHRTPETALQDVWEHGEEILGSTAQDGDEDGRYENLAGGQALQLQLIMDRLEELSKNVEKLLSDMEEMKEKRIYIENMNYMIDDGLVNDRIDMAQFNRDFGAFCTRMGYLKMNMN